MGEIKEDYFYLVILYIAFFGNTYRGQTRQRRWGQAAC